MTQIELKSSDLVEEGLLMEVEIMPSFAFIKEKEFKESEIPVVRTMALFDTGAKTCAVDKSIIETLRISPYKISSVKTPFHTIDSEVYQLIFKIPEKKEYFPVTAVIADFSQDTCKAIIGRDFLQYCTLVYNGANQTGNLIILK